MSDAVVPEKFEKKTDTFSICVTNREIELNIFCDNVVTKVYIIGEAKVYGEFNEWVDMGDWLLNDSTHGVLEFLKEDVSIKLNLSSDEIEKIFDIILKDNSL